MNAKQDGQAEEDAHAIDSIALEALRSEVIPGTQPCAVTEHGGAPWGAEQTHTVGLNRELADGARIDEYCERGQLDVPARLKLFKQVCDAVHSAHQHGIIHRNLKPENILVTPNGVPKLINFGTTKAIHAALDHDPSAEGTMSSTLTENPALSLEYTSPEQVTGEPVTTASDIYSLGVILYVLLTGRRPYHLKTGDTGEIVQAICAQAPERPSRVGTVQDSLPGQFKRRLGADLDSITLTAMRKDPETRYRSADHFANDLERYLAGFPANAHRGSLVYRANKFVRRHAVAVVLSGTLFAALFAGSMAGFTGLILARRARARAEDSFRLGRQAVNQFFTRVSEERILNQPGLHPLRNVLLEDAKRFYEEFLSQHSGDRALRADLALARTQLAQIFSLTGSTTEALGQFQQAIVLWDHLVATQPANSAYREALAHALNEQGQVIMRQKGELAEAERVFHRALDLMEPQVAATQSPGARHELSMILLNFGMVQKEQGELEEATKSIKRSLLMQVEEVTENSDSLDPLIFMAKGHALLGQIFLEDADSPEPALTEYQQAIQLLEKATSRHPELPDQALELALLLGDVSRIQQMAGQLDSALGSAHKAVEILERLERQYANVVDYEKALGGTYQIMSDLHRQRIELSEALAFAQKAQKLLGRLVELHPKTVTLRLELAKSQNILGRMLQQTGEPVEALRSFQRAVDIYESMPELAPDDGYHLSCNIALAIRLLGVKNGSGEMIELSKLSKTDLLRRERYASRAIELLRRATGDGPVDFDALQSNADLDPLRDRPDFQALLDELREKTTDAKQ
jgi:eukaryotic-like serine/threonine-protein kinase